MSNVVTSLKQLEDQLREDGYKGTRRAMRLLKILRSSLEEAGFSFEKLETPVKESNTKGTESFVATLDSLV